MQTIAIFASGNGTNAENLIRYFSQHDTLRVGLVATDRPNAVVIERSRRLGMEVWVFDRKELHDPAVVRSQLLARRIDAIVLAGYLGLVPKTLLDLYPSRILNIHPGLLPGFGGRGMYGDRVHQKVIDTRQQYSGISIHLIDEEYDRGQMLCEVRLRVYPEDSADSLAARIHRLEYRYYPLVIEEYLTRPDTAGHASLRK